MHKETIQSSANRGVPSKKGGRKIDVEDNNISPSKTSFFGSLRRGTSTVAVTSTPKGTPTATKPDQGKKKGVQLRNKPPDKERKPWFRSTANNILRKEPIKSSSTTSLNTNIKKSANITDTKKSRPLTFALPSNVTVRRGQNPKLDGQNLPDNLSRTSSITNIDAEQKPGKGAKPRKSSSRDRIDKIGESKKNEKKGVTKNNNKLDSGDSPYPSIDSLQEEEFLQLRRQLQEMAQEKSNLALQLGEQKGQLNMLQKEIQSLKEESNLQLEQLTEENTALRNRLRDVAHSPLSDNEKQQLLYETHHRHHSSSAPASIATNLIDEGHTGDITACPTPDWDKHSSSNVSEVSVACLQDKINQMQETHYSTNEELQATLQELTDLQRQLTELQQENERLNEEKTLMFDSLCRQTERLNDSRSEVESLKQLLYREKDESGQYESAVEREQKLVGLLKSAQEEKQALLLKLEQISNEIQEARAAIVEKDERLTQLSERVQTLESTLDAKHAEHKLLDQELAQAKDQCSGRQIEINRLTDLLDNARTKITELEQDRTLSDKSELDELLDNARKEKDSLESEVAHLKEQLAISKNEIEKLKEQVSVLQEECKVTRNNARTTQCDLEYQREKLLMEKSNLNSQLIEFQEAINELQVQSQCQLEDKRQLSAVLSETQRNLSEAERKNLILETELQELRKIRTEEVEEWEKFQNDLLTSVRVANDFKTEAQQELQRMIMENKSLREKERQLKSEIEKLKGGKKNKKEDSQQIPPIPKPKVTEKQFTSEMETLFGMQRKSKDKPRRSKDNIDVAVAVEDKGKEKKPDNLTKIVKRREKQSSRNKKNKTLSVEEELLLKSLNDWYENIDKNLPEDKLTEEQKVVKKLKALYEDDSLKEKPVAHKPKNQLAISKPLLDSVFLNPKLEEIANDPSMPTIEELEHTELLNYENDAPELRKSPDVSNRRGQAQSDGFINTDETKRISIIGRSKSYDDLHNLDQKYPVLYRSTEAEDLRKEVPLIHVYRDSSILPSDSVSNPRYSDFAAVIRGKTIKDSTDNVKLTRKSSVNFETLETIVASIPENTPEDQLTSEQKFAVRLKKALDVAERKNTLRKIRKGKHIIISSPTADSVQKNVQLRDILLNPRIQSVRRNSETGNTGDVHVKSTVRQSMSYQDISFNFNKDTKNKTSVIESGYGFNRKDSIPETFSNAEFDIDTTVTSSYDSRSLHSFGTSIDSSDKNRETVKSSTDNETENNDKDLLYNETLTKKNHGNVKPKPDEKSQTSQEQNLNHGNKIYTDSAFGSVSGKFVKYKYEVKPSEEIGKSATVVIHEEHLAVLDNLEDPDESSDLMYNETLNKNMKYNKQRNSKEEFANESKSLIIPDIIIDVTDSSVCKEKDKTIDDELCTQKTDEVNITDEADLTYEASSFDLVDRDQEQDESSEYDYQAILRENRYGVIPPLNIRISYKDVVKEIKNRFSYSNVGIPENDDSSPGSTYFEEFCGGSKEAGLGTSNMNNIDLEMEEIFKKYLRTPVSKVITQIESSNETACNMQEPSKIDNQQKVDKVTRATNYADFTDSNEIIQDDSNLDNESVEEIVLIINDSQDYLNQTSSNTVEDFDDIHQAIVKTEHNQLEQISSRTLNNSHILETFVGDYDTIDNKLSCDLDKEFVFTEKIRGENLNHQIVESVNKDLSFLSQDACTVLLSQKDDNSLSEEEIRLIRSVKSKRFSRPLSEINDTDLQIIEHLSAKYLENPETINEVVVDGAYKAVKNTNPIKIVSLSDDDACNNLSLNQAEHSGEVCNPLAESRNLEFLENGESVALKENMQIKKVEVFDNNSELTIERENDPSFDEPVKNNAVEGISENREVTQESTDDVVEDSTVIEIKPNDNSIESKEKKVLSEDESSDSILENENSRSLDSDSVYARQADDECAEINDTREVQADDVKETVDLPNTGNTVTENKEIVAIEKQSELYKENQQSADIEEAKSSLKHVEDDANNDTKTDSGNKNHKTGADGQDDLGLILEKMLVPSVSSRKKKVIPMTEKTRLDYEKPRIITRNANYGSVRSKLDYFSKQNPEVATPSVKPRSEFPLSDRRKVKSWAEHFEKRSLDALSSSYEPVYANLSTLGIQLKTNERKTTKIDKKPLPVPRTKNLGSASKKNYDSTSSDTQNDVSIKEVKMSDCKIISENDTENLNQELPGSEYNNIGKFKVPDLPPYYETPKVMLEGPPKEGDIEDSDAQGIHTSEKFLEMHDDGNLDTKVEDDSENLAAGAETSYSSIAVAGKFEALDLTKHSDDDIEEIPSGTESHLNLFHLETPSYDESYLSMFKSPEDKMYEDISGTKRPQKGYFQFAYLGEVSGTNSREEVRRVVDEQKDLDESQSTPKIIDFVPLDEGTKPYFKKDITIKTDISNEPNYDTLEREKTFQVLNIAASTGAVRKSTSSIEHSNSKSGAPIRSRASFNAAKKVFENLLEANLERDVQDKSKVKTKGKESSNLLDKSSESDINTSSSSVDK